MSTRVCRSPPRLHPAAAISGTPIPRGLLKEAGYFTNSVWGMNEFISRPCCCGFLIVSAMQASEFYGLLEFATCNQAKSDFTTFELQAHPGSEQV